MQFEWDIEKAAANLEKHGVNFSEAETVFDDLFNIHLYDSAHSEIEHRFVVFGQSRLLRLLVVSYTERNEKIRIISVRELTAKERRDYEQGRFE